MKRKLKILIKSFKNQKSINVAPFNKDVAPEKSPKIYKGRPTFILDSRE